MTGLYLAILSRPPTRAETATVEEYLRPSSGGNFRAGVDDLVWALVNSKEFLYRH